MEENKFPCIVADCSFLVSYLLCSYSSEEKDDAAKIIVSIIENNGQIYVPQIFWYEINNVLLYKTRPNKDGNSILTNSEMTEILYDLSELPIFTDSMMDFEIQTKIRDLANQYNLTFYDASYLELAHRYNIELKTFDKQLQNCQN